MNHQPFENWLLSGESLTPEQDNVLNEHLQTCAACRRIESSWLEVHQLLQITPLSTPAAGFTARWRGRLTEQRLKRQQQAFWIILSITLIIPVALFTILALQVIEFLLTPAQWLVVWAYILSVFFSLLQMGREVVSVIGRIWPVLPLTGLFYFTGLVSLLMVAWVIVYQQLIFARRIRP